MNITMGEGGVRLAPEAGAVHIEVYDLEGGLIAHLSPEVARQVAEALSELAAIAEAAESQAN